MNDVCVIIPTYNEAETIGGLVFDLRRLGHHTVFVIDDSVEPDTRLAAERYGATVLSGPALGLGQAIAYGLFLAHTKGFDYAVVIDAGGTQNPHDIDRMIDVGRWHRADLVIASRFAKGTKSQGWRTVLSRVATFLFNAVHGTTFTDVTTGFRLYNLNAIITKPCVAQGHAFQFELLSRFVRRGLRIVEIPTPYLPLTNSSLRFKTIVEAARTMWRLWRKR